MRIIRILALSGLVAGASIGVSEQCGDQTLLRCATGVQTVLQAKATRLLHGVAPAAPLHASTEPSQSETGNDSTSDDGIKDGTVTDDIWTPAAEPDVAHESPDNPVVVAIEATRPTDEDLQAVLEAPLDRESGSAFGRGDAHRHAYDPRMAQETAMATLNGILGPTWIEAATAQRQQGLPGQPIGGTYDGRSNTDATTDAIMRLRAVTAE